MANFNYSNLVPLAVAGVGALIAYHFLTNREDPSLAAAGNTPNYPDFPRVGIDPNTGSTDPQVMFPHPYAHPIIPRYVGAPAYFQNSIPLDGSHYNDDIWYDKQNPPLLVTVSQNQPTAETYSHHHFYFETPEPEATPLDNGILKNIT